MIFSFSLEEDPGGKSQEITVPGGYFLLLFSPDYAIMYEIVFAFGEIRQGLPTGAGRSRREQL